MRGREDMTCIQFNSGVCPPFPPRLPVLTLRYPCYIGRPGSPCLPASASQTLVRTTLAFSALHSFFLSHSFSVVPSLLIVRESPFFIQKYKITYVQYEILYATFRRSRLRRLRRRLSSGSS